jgi:hypothetical protein
MASSPAIRPLASPFFTMQQLWRTEMSRVLDESTQAFERGAAELERTQSEANRFAQAQAKAMGEAGRAWIAGVRTMMG